MKHEDEQTRTDPQEKSFVDQLASLYAPRPWTSEQRARFDARLRARIQRPQRRSWMVPALAAVAAAALVWIRLSGGPGGAESDPGVASGWESELFLSNDVSPLEDRDDGEALPDDYLAIASLFLDG
jgi:hypothetical protein